MIAEILFTSVAEPDSQDLRDLLFFRFGKAVVELQGALALETGDAVSMGVPVGSCESDTT